MRLAGLVLAFGRGFLLAFFSHFIESTGDMDDHLLAIFQGELETQCQFVMMGAVHVNANLERRDSTGVWFGLQAVLISASNASKLLWGAGRNKEEARRLHEARRRLRESVNVDDSSPLNNRRVRNSFEHFDERIDSWFTESKHRNYIGRTIGDAGGNTFVFSDPTAAEEHVLFGHFDPSTTIVSFWDRSTALQPIVAEIEQILAALKNIRLGPKAPKS